MKNRSESMISNDGAVICYQAFGEGPGLIVLSGVNTDSGDYKELASLLADKLPVYVIERRGRNGSSPQREDYCLQKECEDAIALLKKRRVSSAF